MDKEEKEQVIVSSDEKAEVVRLPVPPDRAVPKFCTSMNLNRLKNNSIIVSLIFSEEPESAALIERVVIGLDHAKSLHEVLGKLLEDVEKEREDNDAND